MGLLISSVGFTTIQYIEATSEVGQASMGYFYFGFRDTNEQYLHGLLSSLLTQLSTQLGSSLRHAITSYEGHDKGALVWRLLFITDRVCVFVHPQGKVSRALIGALQWSSFIGRLVCRSHLIQLAASDTRPCFSCPCFGWHCLYSLYGRCSRWG